jgi:DNA polymerase-3 subunit delta'
MNPTCSNKLLKILEEPPEKTVFLLVSNDPDHIITTILSRTQHIHIPRLSEDEIIGALLKNDNLEIEEEDARYAAHIANGSYLNALAVLNEGDENKLNFERFMMIMRLAWQVGNKKDHASLKTLKKWSDDMALAAIGRERQKNFLSYAQRMTRENFILNIQQPELNYLTSLESDFSKRFSPFINERNVEQLMNEFGLAERQIEQNANAKIVFFDLTLKIIMLLKR